MRGACHYPTLVTHLWYSVNVSHDRVWASATQPSYNFNYKGKPAAAAATWRSKILPGPPVKQGQTGTNNSTIPHSSCCHTWQLSLCRLHHQSPLHQNGEPLWLVLSLLSHPLSSLHTHGTVVTSSLDCCNILTGLL